MKKIAKVIRITSKVAFKKLHKQGSLFCSALHTDILITNLFYYHISGSAKKRSLQEVILRLSCIVMVADILEHGNIVEKRIGTYIEGRKSDIAYKIQFKISGALFSLIVSKRGGKYYLISTFVDL